jgi:hypothetical protein
MYLRKRSIFKPHQIINNKINEKQIKTEIYYKNGGRYETNKSRRLRAFFKHKTTRGIDITST